FALYVIAGGLRIGTPFDGKPAENLAVLLVGALIASFIGTTGAAMLLIRPLLESIHRRKYRAHTIVFFIFIVCNCGGCLLPIGDPPLFMGYLRGVPFLWTMGLWKEWLLVNGLLLGAYAAIDTALFRRERREIQAADDHKRYFVEGIVNIPLLAAAIAAVAVLVPGKELPGTGFVVPSLLREIVLFSLAGASWLLTKKQVRRANHFEFGAIIEVAAIFIGIFITMQTPLEVLTASGPKLGIESPIAFYWVTGALSSFLDNAPTYVVFFEIAKTLPMAEGEAYVQLANSVIREDLLTAISLGAVFMGANTYIGNGPNFMVKAIAESDGVKMPSFFGYMLWSVGILVPLLALAEIFFP
ncbi:MAG: sodium:proton antiporter, partial [Phycisphaerales bacterium]